MFLISKFIILLSLIGNLPFYSMYYISLFLVLASLLFYLKMSFTLLPYSPIYRF